MAGFVINAVVKQQLAIAYLMLQEKEPDLTIEEFGKRYTDFLKSRTLDIQNVIKQLSTKDKEKKKKK